MIIVRSTFTAKPGHAGKLVAHAKEIAQVGKQKNPRCFTDVTGDFNTVVLEHEVESLTEFDTLMQRYATDPEIKEKTKGYTDLWLTGKRELFRLA
jgi:hypothetical protein